MTTKRLFILSSVLTLAIAVPLVLLAMSTDANPRLERFLQRRQAVLSQLDENAAKLPDGVEALLPPGRTLSLDWAGHIRTLVGNGREWSGDGYVSYELVLSKKMAAMPSGDVARKLKAHFGKGLENLALTSNSKSGGSIGLYGKRATNAQLWKDAEGELIVTLSVNIDSNSRAAHVHRFVHERFE